MTTIVLNIATFRAQFPAFANVVTYPDPAIQAQWNVATFYTSPEWIACQTMTLAQQGFLLDLLTAHLLALNAMIAAGTANPGAITGATVDKVSVTLQAAPTKDSFDFWLSSTPYGRQILALLQIKSAGGFYVGGLPERSAFRKVGGIFL